MTDPQEARARTLARRDAVDAIFDAYVFAVLGNAETELLEELERELRHAVDATVKAAHEVRDCDAVAARVEE